MKPINKIKKYIFLITLSLSIMSCASDDLITKSTIPVDLTTYVALGNSLTAGYMDQALYEHGQKNSYPEVLAKKFEVITGKITKFKSPFVGNENGGIIGLEGSGFPNRLIFTPPSTISTKSGTGTPLVSAVAPFYNLGVPGARSFHLLAPGYGNPSGIGVSANPYYVRMATSTSSSVLGDAMLLKPTFFSLWIGNNDVLAYSTAGGVAASGNNPIANRITPTATFSLALTTAIATLTKDGAKGVIANIPDVTSIPYFTTVSSSDITLDSPNSTALNNAYATYNATMQTLAANGTISQAEADRRQISFVVGANMPVILDEELTDLTGINPTLKSMRKLEAGELILLTAAKVLPLGQGTQTPLEDNFILTATEIAEINTATATFNAIIKDLASQYDLAFFDANALMNTLNKDGILANGTTYNAKFISKGGNAFSLDGVHPNAKGYGIIANGFIETINEKFNLSLTPVDISMIPVVLN